MHSAVQLTGSIVNQTDIGLVWLGFDNNLRYKIQTHPNLSINLLNINKQDFYLKPATTGLRSPVCNSLFSFQDTFTFVTYNQHKVFVIQAIR